ncbi:DUF4244 domain-containing protein [Corynebacterium sp. AOP40-9SA-29]|uniref:DUF4244 domain-containing protein n=1 Tax=Corynebacterium sp. AOP40-9SA-29 TaxID=3457677 RepID=UPI004034BABF
METIDDEEQFTARELDTGDAGEAGETENESENRGLIRWFGGDEQGMSTIEYALGCVAAAALGALLYLVVTSDAVEGALTAIFQRALDTQ